MGKRKRAPELTFQQHVADYLVREHKYGVLEQTDITDTEHCIAEDQLWAFLNATQADTLKKLADDYRPDKKVFYVKVDNGISGSSIITEKYYGPFTGDPHKTLDLKPPLPEPAAGSPRPKLAFRDLDLTDAPMTTNLWKLPDVWDYPAGATAHRGLRASVSFSQHLLEQGYSVWIAYVADKDVFYVNCDSVWSRTEHFYGPFKGDPFKRFDLEAFPRAAGVRAHAGRPAEPPWGEAVQGVQVRLQADKTTWKAGETPTLAMDLKNDGKTAIHLSPNPVSGY